VNGLRGHAVAQLRGRAEHCVTAYPRNHQTSIPTALINANAFDFVTIPGRMR